MDSESDASTILWSQRLDEFLTAVQQGDDAQVNHLLSLEPKLAEWRDTFCELEDFANLIGPMRSVPVSDDSMSKLSPSTSFDKFELQEEIGHGGMGIVFRAFQPDLDRTVALKMLNGRAFATPDQRRRFSQEARLASRIRHPNIVVIHEVGEFAGQPYFTMDFIPGVSLAQRLRQGPVPIEQAVSWAITLANAAEHLHANGIHHRDLKPSNVIFDHAGQPCLVDFGLARAIDENLDATTSGTVLGTPSYMSPEQAAGRVREISARSDVYSLGAILYEMLCGRPPFVADSSFDTLLLVLENEPKPLRTWNRAVPKRLEQICLRCLEKSPDRRYQSAKELARDLQRWSRGDDADRLAGAWITDFRRLILRHPAVGYRLIGLVPTLLALLLRSITVPETWSFYRPIATALALWSGLTLLWEYVASTISAKKAVDYAFVITDIIFLTWVLHLGAAANSSHVAGYLILVLLSSLTLNRHLIWTSGLSSLICYLILVSLSEVEIVWVVTSIFVVAIACCTILSDYQVRRISLLISRSER